jgi:hypothetical protein
VGDVEVLRYAAFTTVPVAIPEQGGITVSGPAVKLS